MLDGFGKTNLSAFRFLVLRMNSVQHTFEFEFLPTKADDPFIKHFSSRSKIDRDVIKDDIPSFLGRHKEFLVFSILNFDLKEIPPDYFILITMARFSENYYAVRNKGLSILALGNWQRFMAPPSLLEFITTLILQESVAAIYPSLQSLFHFGTKGCLFDFTSIINDVKYKVLNAHICYSCRMALARSNHPNLADELTYVLSKEWLGNPSEPTSPASITSKLGYNLFTTKGLEATTWEKFVQTIQQEGVKQLITIVSGIALTALLLWLGLK